MWPYVKYILLGCIKLLNICFYLCSVVSKFNWQYQCHNKNGFYYGFWTTTYNFEILYRDNGEGFWGVLKDIFFRNQTRFFFKYFLKNKFPNFVHFFFIFFPISFERMIPYLSILLLLFKKSPFHIGTFISFFAML